ncbi:hypothetical protein CEXT_465831 [Caerostris extrusa]|uniref:Uncharacterized protein n=1 Tax=Caerostris extrusa TaxID=172846 RepID=A0AAV4PVW1_CAEEX|nr:hypothetical protein CEXT_465831 [Caerostris extrusa]
MSAGHSFGRMKNSVVNAMSHFQQRSFKANYDDKDALTQTTPPNLSSTPFFVFSSSAAQIVLGTNLILHSKACQARPPRNSARNNTNHKSRGGHNHKTRVIHFQEDRRVTYKLRLISLEPGDSLLDPSSHCLCTPEIDATVARFRL